MAYLHGVEIIQVASGVRPINVVRSSVIGLVGISPRGAAQTLTQVLSATDAAQFGLEVPGFTIPQALNAIYGHTPSTVLVVNVYDEATHATAVTLEAVVIASGKGKMAFAPVQAGFGATVSIFTNVGGTVAFTGVYGTDYTIDDYGNVKALTTTMADATYYMTYKKLVPGNVTTSNIIGAVTTTTRTGMKMFEAAYATFGYKPKILITPGYSSINAIRVAMETEAPKYKAVSLVDAPAGTTVTAAITGRGPSGAINFNTSDKRTIPLFPMVKAYDTDSNADQVRPYSQYFAGLMSLVDFENGYWYSPGNKYLKGLTGVEKAVTFDPGDSTGTTEANQLNANGIVTLVNSGGILSWGDRNASFPSSTLPESFISVLRTRDVIEDSIQYAMLPFVSQPVTLPQIDSILATVQSFLNELVGRGALIDGTIKFDPSLNSNTTLAAGQIIFSLSFMPPVPAERLTFLSTIDITMLKSLIKAAA